MMMDVVTEVEPTEKNDASFYEKYEEKSCSPVTLTVEVVSVVVIIVAVSEKKNLV